MHCNHQPGERQYREGRRVAGRSLHPMQFEKAGPHAGCCHERAERDAEQRGQHDHQRQHPPAARLQNHARAAPRQGKDCEAHHHEAGAQLGMQLAGRKTEGEGGE